MHLEEKDEWFSTWFNSPYYHMLYDNRNDQEAEAFLARLIEFLNPDKNATVLDLACGAGRHVRALAHYLENVSGCDLSTNSIQEAQKKSPAHLHFYVHDMREPLPHRYQYIFNLFTSFGYFETTSENALVLKSISESLDDPAVLVIDFMNTEKIIKHLVPHEIIQKSGIDFQITKEVKAGRILKTIEFEAKGKKYVFQEKVQALTEAHFDTLLSNQGFEIIHKAGNYALDNFDKEESDRLILICKKK